MKTKKLLSILLALMMMLSVVPMYASAADPIALTESNITTYPTVEGTCYYGQVIADVLTLKDGVVEYNGEVVEGEFTFTDSSKTASSIGSGARADFTFTPSNTDMYSGFSVSRSRKVKYTILAADLELADNNNPPVATVDEGKALSSAVITGSGVVNKYAPTEQTALNATWSWINPDTTVTESGYYSAKIQLSNYNVFSYDIYVEVKKAEIPFAQITELPAVDGLTYDGTTTWADVALVGGKAVEEGTETEVPGTFAITGKTGVVTAGTHEVAVTFTPDDTTKYNASSTTITVEVAKAPFKFLDENGAETIPEITVPYGTKYRDLESQLNALKTNSSATVISYIFENEKAVIPVGENEIEVTAAPSGDKNVEKTTVKIKVTVEPATVEMTVGYSATDAELQLNEVPLIIRNKNSSDATPKGTFAIYADGELVKEGAKANEPFSWFPKATKEYELKVVYTPTENDPCIVNEFTYAYPITMTRIIKSGENVGAPVRNLCGATVEVNWQGATENFENWVITDANGNAIDLGVDLTADKISFTMPDYDLNIEANGLGNIFDMDFGDLSEGDSEWAIINIIRNIIAKFKSFLQQLIETFQSIGG